MVESGLVLHRGYARRELDSCPVSVGEVSPSTRKAREASFLEYASTFTLAGWFAVSITFGSAKFTKKFTRWLSLHGRCFISP